MIRKGMLGYKRFFCLKCFILTSHYENKDYYICELCGNKIIKIKKKKQFKYKTNSCKNCGSPCWDGSFVCGSCYSKVFHNNKNNIYDDWRKKYQEELNKKFQKPMDLKFIDF